MKYKLYSDSEVWHKEYSADWSDEDIAYMECHMDKDDLDIVTEAADYKDYQVISTGFGFTITYVY